MNTKEKALMIYLDRLAVMQLAFVQMIGEPAVRDMQNSVITNSPQAEHLIQSINNLFNDLYVELGKQNSASAALEIEELD